MPQLPKLYFFRNLIYRHLFSSEIMKNASLLTLLKTYIILEYSLIQSAHLCWVNCYVIPSTKKGTSEDQ